jgi:glycosylphosphatidylinositol transamidase (GPIT) subunit GPI8
MGMKKLVGLFGMMIVSLLGVVEASVEVDNIWAVLVAGSNEWYNYRHQVILINLK